MTTQPERSGPSTGASASGGDGGRNGGRARMTGKERREQLLDVGRKLFAEQGFEGTSVEEIACTAQVSKHSLYEHVAGKEGLYAFVVDRQIRTLLDATTASLGTEDH